MAAEVAGCGLFGSSPSSSRLSRPRSLRRSQRSATPPFSWSASSIVAPGGHVVAFTLSQAIVGVGWNWCFVAATSGLAKLTRPRERPKVQAANDVFIFTISGLLGILAAVVYRAVGWRAMQLAAFIAGGAILVVVSISEGLERREPALAPPPPAPAPPGSPIGCGLGP